jgi:hypothetical protein
MLASDLAPSKRLMYASKRGRAQAFRLCKQLELGGLKQEPGSEFLVPDVLADTSGC